MKVIIERVDDGYLVCGEDGSCPLGYNRYETESKARTALKRKYKDQNCIQKTDYIFMVEDK